MNTVPVKRITIPTEIRQAMKEHARGQLPNECCGMLSGYIRGDTAVVTHRYELTNIRRSPTRFEADPRELIQVHRKLREEKTELLAIYHSHPHSEPIPSITDLAEHHSGSNVACIILGLSEGETRIRSWRLFSDGFEVWEMTTDGHS